MAKLRVKRALGIAAIVLLVACAAFFVVARRFVFPKHFDVVSIKTTEAYQSAALLERAWALPVAASFKRARLLSQPNGSLCGPTSVADVMRSLGSADATPARVLEGTGLCPTGVCFGGVSLDELAKVTREKTHRRVTVLRNLSLAAFRSQLARTNDPSRRYIINFDRGPLFGTASGHHSPIGGYLADLDLVFVLDVNAKYHPWLVPSARLYQAMNTVDSSTEQKRGMLLVE